MSLMVHRRPPNYSHYGPIEFTYPVGVTMALSGEEALEPPAKTQTSYTCRKY